MISMQDHTIAVTTTAACDTGRCGSCRGVVLSITDGHLGDCACSCHDPAPVDPEQELDDLLADEGDRLADWDWS
jgi:hypothetical protein